MNAFRPPLFLLLLLSAVFAAPALAGEREQTLRLPPESLADWYKPANKRQVWLHNMFKLRRELLAVSDYLALEDRAGVEKWSERLASHYARIGEMVPEWRDELEPEYIDRLRTAARAGDFEGAARQLRKLGLNCRSCHRDYRAVTAALYRTPDFGPVRVEDSESLEEEDYPRVMDRLSRLLNRIKIASEDGHRQRAADSFQALRRRLDDLGQSCESCHRDEAPRERILGEDTQASLAALERTLEAADVRQTGRYLGELAVQVCARCHGVHRTLADLKGVIAPGTGE